MYGLVFRVRIWMDFGCGLGFLMQEILHDLMHPTSLKVYSDMQLPKTGGSKMSPHILEHQEGTTSF